MTTAAINLTNENVLDMIATVGASEVNKALGYAISYAAIAEFDAVTIYQEHKGIDFVCIYTQGDRTFTMGGVYRPELNKYTFHS